MRINQLIKDYLEYLEFEKSRSKNTIVNYERWLKKLYNFTGNIDSKELDYQLLKSFIKNLHETIESPTYRSSILTVVRCLLKYANIHEIPTLNSNLVEVGSRKRSQIIFLEKQELLHLLSMPNIKSVTGLRDKAILELLASTGMRCGEIINLKKTQVNNQKSITILGKGDKLRLVFISKRANKWLTKYLVSREDSSTALFIGNRKISDDDTAYNNLTVRTIQRVVKKYAEEAKFKKNVSPHTLRHSFALNLLENGAHIFYIKEMLGHVDIRTTEFYLHTTNKHLEKMYFKYYDLQ